MAGPAVDPLEMRVEDLAEWWPRSVREELASVGANRVRDLLQLTPLDIICSPKGSLSLLSAIGSECRDLDVDGAVLEAFHGRRGTSRPIPPAAPFEHPWGCLYVVHPPADWGNTSEKAKNALAGLVIRHFERSGFRTSLGALARTDDEVMKWRGPPRLQPPRGAALTDEDVLLSWDWELGLAVLVRQQEMAVIEHPLAAELSIVAPVVALRHVPGRPIEIAMFRDNARQEVDLAQMPRKPERLERLGISISMLAQARAEPRRFCALSGIHVRGFASTVSRLDELSPDESRPLSASELRYAIDTHFGTERVLHFVRA